MKHDQSHYFPLVGCPVFNGMEASAQISLCSLSKARQRDEQISTKKKEMFSGSWKLNWFAKYFRETYCKWLIFISFVQIELTSEDQLTLFYQQQMYKIKSREMVFPCQLKRYKCLVYSFWKIDPGIAGKSICCLILPLSILPKSCYCSLAKFHQSVMLVCVGTKLAW